MSGECEKCGEHCLECVCDTNDDSEKIKRLEALIDAAPSPDESEAAWIEWRRAVAGERLRED